MSATRRIEAGGIAPSSGGRVVQLRAVKSLKGVSPCDQDFAILEQRRGVMSGVGVAGATPPPGGWFVQLRTEEAHEQDLAIGQQCCRARVVGQNKIAGVAPCPRGGVVK